MKRERLILDMWMANISDDRGLIRKCWMNLSDAQHSDQPLTKEQRLRWKHELRKGMVRPSAVMGLFFGLFIVVGQNALYMILPQWWMSAFTILVLVPPMWIAGDLLFLGPMMRPRYRQVRRELARSMRRCAWCLYSLDPSLAGADGCVVCPECGGAWRLDHSENPSNDAPGRQP